MLKSFLRRQRGQTEIIDKLSRLKGHASTIHRRHQAATVLGCTAIAAVVCDEADDVT